MPLPVFPLPNSNNSHFLEGLTKEHSKAGKWQREKEIVCMRHTHVKMY